MTDESRAITEAAAVAAKAAAMAAEVARDVAARAAEVAASVAMLASKTSESVVILANDISYIKSDLSEIKKKLESTYVTQDQFAPVRAIAFSLMGFAGLAMLGAIARVILVS